MILSQGNMLPRLKNRITFTRNVRFRRVTCEQQGLQDRSSENVYRAPFVEHSGWFILTAQAVKCLPGKQVDLSLYPQHHVKAESICQLSTVLVERQIHGA